MIGVLLLLVYRQKGKIDKSYNDLFVINRDFVKQQEFTRQRMLELSNRLKSSEAELAACVRRRNIPTEPAKRQILP